MKKSAPFIFIIILMMIIGCPADDSQNDDASIGSQKITSLQDVIDSNDIKTGETIDLSKTEYSGITNCTATVNKAIKISGGNFSSGTLSVVTDGVELSNLSGSASVVTSSSLKIASSSLSNLTVASSHSLSSNQIISRSDTAGSAPSIEIEDSKVTGKILINVDGTVLSLSGDSTEIAVIEANGNNCSLLVSSDKIKINKIARWKCAVTFDPKGGNWDGYTSSKIKEVDYETPFGAAQSVEDPKRTGYVFGNWYYGSEPMSSDTKITGSITVEAHWRESHTVTIADNIIGGIVSFIGMDTEDRSMDVAVGDEVILFDIDPNENFELTSLTIKRDDDDSTVDVDEEDDYRFTMPDADVTVTAVFEPIAGAVAYIERDDIGTSELKAKGEDDYHQYNNNALSDGWYYVYTTLTVYDRITVTGGVHLILADGVTLTADKGIAVGEDAELYIYGQSDGTGQLIANGVGGAGIGGDSDNDCGAIVIHGGNITATGDDGFAGIGGRVDSNASELEIYGEPTIEAGSSVDNAEETSVDGYKGSPSKYVHIQY